MNSNHQKSIHFIKMHGLGNDYIFVDTGGYSPNDSTHIGKMPKTEKNRALAGFVEALDYKLHNRNTL